MKRYVDRIRPGRKIDANSAVLLPFTPDGKPGYEEFEKHLQRTSKAGIVPAVNIGSYLGWILILIGLAINLTGLAWLGVAVFSGGALFAFVTLPVEFDASARARRLLASTGLVTAEEQNGVNSVLNAAALTYVAGLATAIMQVLYYVTLIGGRRRR